MAKKKPTAVLKAQGSRHYTKDEMEEREEKEIKVPDHAGEIKAPDYLTSSMRKEFNHLAPILESMGVLTAIDTDLLARYLIAKNNYLKATEKLMTVIGCDVDDAVKWSTVQDRFFKQCRACGADLGLSVSARANLLIPQSVDTGDRTDEEADLFGD